MRRALLGTLTATAVIVSIVTLAPRVSAQDEIVWQPPVDAPIADPFRPPPTPYAAGNRGIEYDLSAGSDVTAVAAGRVTFAGSVGRGLFVVVTHPDGLRSTYANVTSIEVVRGQTVEAGTKVAVAGPGFHLTARLGDTYIDPALLFAGAEVVIALVDGPPPPAVRGRRAGGRPGRSPWDPLRAVLHDASELHLSSQIESIAEAVEAWHHQECTPDRAGAPPPIAARSRVLLQVGGLGSSHDSASIGKLDPIALGYHPDDVVGFSYAGGCTPEPFGLSPGPGSLTTELGPTPYEAVHTFQAIDESAARLADLVDAVAAERPGVSIDVAAHSLGGVVTRRATEILAERHGNAHPLDVVLTIGSPHQGADLATLATASSAGLGFVDAVSPAVAELRDAPAVIQLSEAGVAALPPPGRVVDGLTAVAVAGSSDLIVPAESAIWPGATNVVVATSLPGATSAHGELAGLPEVARELELARAGWAPRCVGLGQLVGSVAAGGAIAGSEDALAVAAGLVSRFIN